jgi:Family of unknown function (DUF6627)
VIKKVIVLVLSVSVAFAALLNSASAAVVTTQQVLSMDQRQELVNNINSQLQRRDVRQAMVSLGVDPRQAEQRVSSLSSQELAELDWRINDLPAGGSILALIGAVFVVLIILELTGVTNVFSNF